MLGGFAGVWTGKSPFQEEHANSDPCVHSVGTLMSEPTGETPLSEETLLLTTEKRPQNELVHGRRQGGTISQKKISHRRLPCQRRGGGGIKGNHKAWPLGNLYLIVAVGRPARFHSMPRPSSKEAAGRRVCGFLTQEILWLILIGQGSGFTWR